MRTLFTTMLLLVLWSGTTTAQTATAPSSGDGTSGNPYQIATLDNLYWLTQNSMEWDKYYIQTADINASASSTWDGGQGLRPIGLVDTSFMGSYDGQGYTIDSMFISRASTQYVGLFGVLLGATVKDLGITNVDVAGQQLTGGLAGGVYASTVQNCYSTGSVVGTDFVGGLAGGCFNYYEYPGIIKFSYSTCEVTGVERTGGFVGSVAFGAQVTDSYSRGNVMRQSASDSSFFGSFSGIVDIGTLTRCYATGSVTYIDASDPTSKGFVGGIGVSGTFNDNFFDNTASNQSTATGATAKTTAEMKTQSTFLTAGWSDSTWYMDGGVNDGYPYLSWQNPEGSPLPVQMAGLMAEMDEETVVLQWTTVTEVDNSGWEVERRIGSSQMSEVSSQTEAESWVKIGFVEGAGTSTTQRTYFFSDPNPFSILHLPSSISYRLKQIDRSGSFSYSEVIEVDATSAPRVFFLSQNYPNPFNPSTTISYTLGTDGPVSLKAYDLIGREVGTLVNEEQKAGVLHEVDFDGSRLASGVYYLRIVAGNRSLMRRMMLIK